jgi:hypothetical protein
VGKKDIIPDHPVTVPGIVSLLVAVQNKSISGLVL